MTSQVERTVSRVTVPKRADDGEWVVRAYDQHGKRFPEADYFTDDRADAEATAAMMTVSRGEQKPLPPRPRMRLEIFAFHVQLLASETAPSRFGLGPCDGVHADVKITEARPELESPTWDDVTINGRQCGNRSGAIQEFCRMVQAVDPELVY